MAAVFERVRTRRFVRQQNDETAVHSCGSEGRVAGDCATLVKPAGSDGDHKKTQVDEEEVAVGEEKTVSQEGDAVSAVKSTAADHVLNTTVSQNVCWTEKNEDYGNKHDLKERTDNTENNTKTDSSTNTEHRRNERTEKSKLTKLQAKQTMKPFQCDMCQKCFRSSVKLERHEVRVHKTKRPFKCDVCPSAFISPSHLAIHQRVHTKETPHLCATCGQGFTTSSGLSRHMRTHTGEKPYVCKTCGKGFAGSGDLSRHVRSHTGERPFKCQTCGAAFGGRTTLKQHILSHTGERPFTCQYCGKGFTRTFHLVQHVRIHTGVKPYKCENCGRGFEQSISLRTHKARKTQCSPKELQSGKGRKRLKTESRDSDAAVNELETGVIQEIETIGNEGTIEIHLIEEQDNGNRVQDQFLAELLTSKEIAVQTDTCYLVSGEGLVVSEPPLQTSDQRSATDRDQPVAVTEAQTLTPAQRDSVSVLLAMANSPASGTTVHSPDSEVVQVTPMSPSYWHVSNQELELLTQTACRVREAALNQSSADIPMAAVSVASSADQTSCVSYRATENKDKDQSLTMKSQQIPAPRSSPSQ